MREVSIDGLRQIIVENCMVKLDPDTIREETPLFGPDGIGLDSLDALQIAVAVEKLYGVSLSDSTGLVAIASSKSADVAKQGKGWWDSDAGMTKVTGRVLEKSQTPVAPMAWDYFVPSKPKSAN